MSLRTEAEPERKPLRASHLELSLPAGFPERYRAAILRAVDQCAVKRHMIAPPSSDAEFVAYRFRGAASSERVYYVSMTAHGVLMAIVFATFFIMGLGYVLERQALGREPLVRLAWLAWIAARCDHGSDPGGVP